MAHTGSCLCGDIQYTIEGEPAANGVCHCKNCQKQAGSAFSTLAAVPKAMFSMSGKPKLYEDSDTDSGNQVQRFFCSRCGSPIYSALGTQPDMVYLKTGTMDDTSSFRPAFNVWCSTKQNWVVLDESVPQMEKQG